MVFVRNETEDVIHLFHSLNSHSHFQAYSTKQIWVWGIHTVADVFSNLSQLLVYFGVDDVRYLGLAITDQLDIAGLVWIRKSKVTSDAITMNVGLRSVRLVYPFKIGRAHV